MAAQHAVLADSRMSRLLTAKPFSTVSAKELQPRRVSAILFSLLGILAAIVAGVGVLGLTTYTVSKRIPEIGLRRALGADALHVVWCITRPVATAVACGAGAGILALSGLERLVRGMLYGVTPHDPVVLLLTVVTMGLLALTFSLLPVIRALRVSPLVALTDA
jgi:ABC-type antimicrobial peptide transport system permease subunit